VSFSVVPPEEKSPTSTASNPDWSILFAEAGLEPSQFTPTDVRWNPAAYADNTASWQSSAVNRSGAPVRIQAAALQGMPVLFRILGPWNQGTQSESSRLRVAGIIEVLVAALLLLTVFLGGLFFARRNLRLGRGDRRNANRLALFILSLSVSTWLLSLPRVSVISLVSSPYLAGLLWVFYIALEPFVRRRWPQSLVSWTRLLSGEWRDPIVSRDMLIGFAMAVFVMCTDWFAHYFLPTLLGHAELGIPYQCDLQAFMGSRFFLSHVLSVLYSNVSAGLGLICLLCIVMTLLKHQKTAIAVCCIGLVLMTPPDSSSLWSVAIKLSLTPIFFIILLRFGFLSAAASFVISTMLREFPIGFQFSAWYSGYGYAALAMLAAVVFYAFRYSLGGRPIIGSPQLDD
jgi:serine/threonine-protein kinase